MAPQRIVALLIVLLAFSVALAALAPDVRDRRSSDRTTTTATTTAETTESEPRPPGGRLIDVEIDLAGNPAAPIPPIESRLGDQIALTVRVGRPGEVIIEGLGEREYAEPAAPARFNLLPQFPGRYDILAPGSDDAAATIVVTPRQRREATRRVRPPA